MNSNYVKKACGFGKKKKTNQTNPQNTNHNQTPTQTKE